MNRYAQLLNGKVIDIREAESTGQLAAVFGPQTYWTDITDVKCEIGYISKYVEGQGVVFVDPSIPTKSYTIDNIEEARLFRLEYLKRKYIEERDKVRWITLKEAVKDGEYIISDEIRYGFDCDQKAIFNFMAAVISVLINEEDTRVDYIAYMYKNGEKGIISISKEEMLNIYNTIRNEQIMVNIKYNEKKSLINKLQTIEEIMKVEWEDD